MKKIISIFFLLVFVLQSSSKLAIITSFYIQREYIAKNMCINRFDIIPVCKGQCYLNEQLKKNEQHEQKIPNLEQKEILLFLTTIQSIPNSPLFNQEKKIFKIQQQFSYSSEYLTKIFHPPQVA